MRDEAARLSALRLYDGILDTTTEQTFNDLTGLAATLCETPISLVDETRQWFKSRHGLNKPQTPRDRAFYAQAIHGSAMMIVEDASRDARFGENPLVTGEPGIRFYAEAPLEVGDGHRLGTLCGHRSGKPDALSRAAGGI